MFVPVELLGTIVALDAIMAAGRVLCKLFVVCEASVSSTCEIWGFSNGRTDIDGLDHLGRVYVLVGFCVLGSVGRWIFGTETVAR